MIALEVFLTSKISAANIFVLKSFDNINSLFTFDQNKDTMQFACSTPLNGGYKNF